MRSERGPEKLARKAILITLAVAAFAAIPSGAEAKGFGVRSVAVHGPGLSGPLVIGRLEFQGGSGQGSPTGILWERMFSDYAPTLVPPLSLGPRYLIEYRLSTFSWPHVAVIHQDLYPYAQSGPLAFTQPHQTWRPGPGAPQLIPSRWHAYPDALITTLQVYGLPAAPSLAPAPHRKVSGQGSQEPPIWIWPAGLLLLATIRSIHLWSRGRRRDDRPTPVQAPVYSSIESGGGGIQEDITKGRVASPRLILPSPHA